MAVKLPSFADVGFDDPRAVGGLPSFPQNDPGAAGMALFGKGVQDVGKAALDIAADQKNKQNQVNSALAEADLDGNLMRFSEAAKNERDPAKLDELRGQLPGYLESAGATITDPDARQLWAAKHKIKIVAAEGIASAQHRKIYNDSFLAGARQQLDEQSRLAAQASDPAMREQAQANIGNILGSLERAGIIGAADGQKLGRDYGEKVIIGTVNWLDANKDPIEAGRFLRENLRHIDPDKAESLSRHLRPLEDREIGRAFVRGPRPGAAGGGGGGAVERFLDLAEQHESGGRNIMQQAVPPNGGFNPSTGTVTGPSTAQGYFQITNTTWREFAPQAGVDNAQYPNAMSAPYEVQRKVARTIATTSGVHHWTDYNKNLKAAVSAAGMPVSGPIAGAAAVPGDVINENTNPELTAQIDAAAATGEPIPLDAAPPGVPDIRAQVARIRAAKASGELTEAQADIAIREVQQDQQQTMLGHERAESDLTLAVARGEKGGADIEDAHQKGLISDTKRTQLQLHIIEEQKKQALRDQMILRVSSAGAGGAPLDPKSKDDRAGLDLHFTAVSKAWPAEEALDRSLAYSAQYGMVPTALQARIRGGLHSGRPELAIDAADTVSRLKNTNPQLVAEIGDENDMRLATSITALTSTGAPGERAVQMAVDGMKAPKAVIEARGDEFKTLRGTDEIKRKAHDTAWLAKQQNYFLTRDPNVNPVMLQEFEDTTKAEFQMTGNLEAARQMALGSINRVWGRTRVGGDFRYMKNAPEVAYAVPNMTPDQNAKWQNEQLVIDAGKARPIGAAPIAADKLRVLEYTGKTGPSGRPLYQVFVVDDKASWEVLRKPGGEPIEWYPDFPRALEFKRQQDATQAGIERARQLRREELERRTIVDPGQP